MPRIQTLPLPGLLEHWVNEVMLPSSALFISVRLQRAEQSCTRHTGLGPCPQRWPVLTSDNTCEVLAARGPTVEDGDTGRAEALGPRSFCTNTRVTRIHMESNMRRKQVLGRGGGFGMYVKQGEPLPRLLSPR